MTPDSPILFSHANTARIGARVAKRWFDVPNLPFTVHVAVSRSAVSTPANENLLIVYTGCLSGCFGGNTLATLISAQKRKEGTVNKFWYTEAVII